ncbi:hypothetical protein T06_10010, partial [Trichinella sp. T6]
MFQYLYPYINSRLLAPAYPPIGMDGKQLLIPLWCNLECAIHGLGDQDLQVPTMIGQFWVLLCPIPVHRGLYSFKERKIARCGWLGGCGGSFLIINGRDGFRFFRALLFKKRLLFHFVGQVLIHRAAFDV